VLSSTRISVFPHLGRQDHEAATIILVAFLDKSFAFTQYYKALRRKQSPLQISKFSIALRDRILTPVCGGRNDRRVRIKAGAPAGAPPKLVRFRANLSAHQFAWCF
jgi:hypothetical protein